MEIHITAHAIERYIDRIDSNASLLEARRKILSQLEKSARKNARTHSGDAYFIGPDFRMVVAEERGRRTVLTVLEAEDDSYNDNDIPELAAALHSEFVAWEMSSQNLKLSTDSTSKRLEKALRANEDLLKGIRRRDETIANIMKTVGNVSVPVGHVTEKRYNKKVEHAKRMTDHRDNFREVLRQVAEILTWDRDVDKALRIIDESSPTLIEHIRR